MAVDPQHHSFPAETNHDYADDIAARSGLPIGFWPVLSGAHESGALYEATDTIDTFVYRALLQTPNIGMSSAAGFIQSVVGFLFSLANGVIRKVSPESSLF